MIGVYAAWARSFIGEPRIVNAIVVPQSSLCLLPSGVVQTIKVLFDHVRLPPSHAGCVVGIGSTFGLKRIGRALPRTSQDLCAEQDVPVAGSRRGLAVCSPDSTRGAYARPRDVRELATK